MNELEPNDRGAEPSQHVPAEVWARARKIGKDEMPIPTWYAGRLETNADSPSAPVDGDPGSAPGLPGADLAAIAEAHRPPSPLRTGTSQGAAHLLQALMLLALPIRWLASFLLSLVQRVFHGLAHPRRAT